MSANAAAAGGAHQVYLPPGAIAAQQAVADSKIPGEEYEEIREQVRFFPHLLFNKQYYCWILRA